MFLQEEQLWHLHFGDPVIDWGYGDQISLVQMDPTIKFSPYVVRQNQPIGNGIRVEILVCL